MRLRKTLAGLTHLLTYNKEPSKDWSLFLVQVAFFDQFLHISIISCNFPGGILMVLSTVLNNIPRQTAWVEGGVEFLTADVQT